LTKQNLSNSLIRNTIYTLDVFPNEMATENVQFSTSNSKKLKFLLVTLF